MGVMGSWGVVGASRRRRVGYALGWLVAVALGVTVGVVAVSTVGASIRDRGPLGRALPAVSGDAEPAAGEVGVDPAAQVRRTVLRGDWGEFEVSCQGVYASGRAARPATGWRVVSYESGPDDDVDAVFSRDRVSVDLEVFCNRGEPTLAEEERHTLPAADD